MILPTKHITVENSLLGVGALILVHLERPTTVSSLWEELRTFPQISTYERFTLGLDCSIWLTLLSFEKANCGDSNCDCQG